MCVCLEGVHQECGKHISNNASLMFPHSWSRIYRWFVASVAVVGVLQECGKHISESSAIIDNLFLWKHISSYLIYSLRYCVFLMNSRHTHQLGSLLCTRLKLIQQPTGQYDNSFFTVI